MKPFDPITKSAPRNGNGRAKHPRPSQAAQNCAVMLLETVPLVMRSIRHAMGKLQSPALTVPQFRSLHYVESHRGADLSSTAEFLGLTLPSTSKLIDQLVRRGIVQRDHDATDRRRMTLRLTPRGEAMLKSARAAVSQQLALMLDRAGSAELAALRKALGLLQSSCPENGTEPCNLARNGNVWEPKVTNGVHPTLTR